MADKLRDDPQDLHPLGAKLRWVEKDANIVRMITGLAILCAILFLLDFVAGRKPYFGLEGWFGFYAIYGFIAFSFIVIMTGYLKRLIGRREDYYAPGAVDAEDYPSVGLDVKDHTDV